MEVAAALHVVCLDKLVAEKLTTDRPASSRSIATRLDRIEGISNKYLFLKLMIA